MDNPPIVCESVTSLASVETSTSVAKSQVLHKKQAFPTSDVSLEGYNHQNARRRYFHSRRVAKGEVDKPWLTNRDPKAVWLTILPLTAIVLGIGLASFLVWEGIRSVPQHKYCAVYQSNFQHGWDSVWEKEVEVGGFGNEQFEETTGTDENAFIEDGMLWIKPTLQNARLITTNSVINLTADGTCTSDQLFNCVAATNTTNGTIVNPVKSARINTKNGAFIRYGRVEVEAKLPSGDWLWPGIWMLPVKNTYGPWPESGEIDIAESRGNNHTYPTGGSNVVFSTLHWGLDLFTDVWAKTTGRKDALRSTFATHFHTFGLEWSENYLFTYIDNRLLKIFQKDFRPGTSLWNEGNFPLANSSNIPYTDPWAGTGRASTPFDQDFYLVLNVAVGGSNGWFKDGQNDGKPWENGSPFAKKDFWDAKDQWYPTWERGSPQMIVKSVKMWQQAGYNGCKA